METQKSKHETVVGEHEKECHILETYFEREGRIENSQYVNEFTEKTNAVATTERVEAAQADNQASIRQNIVMAKMNNNTKAQKKTKGNTSNEEARTGEL